jgi:hypothetical protein
VASGLDLGKQIGPLPLGAWIGVVAGGLGLAWYVNRNSGSATSNPIEESTGIAAETGVGTGGQQFIYDPPQGGPASPTVYETNEQWGRAAILHLLSEGKDPGTSTLAVSRYLGEYSLTADQQALVSLAIAKLGPPPQLPSNPPDLPGTTPTPTPTPTPTTPALTAPKNLRTWGKGPSRLTVPLQWDPVPGAVSYRLYRKGVAFNVGHSIDTKATVGGLRPNTSYTFHVRALDKTGKLGPSSTSKTYKTKK